MLSLALCQDLSMSATSYTTIEPGILGLVDAMNATGCIETIASCEGHVSFGRAPYVYFRTTVNMASAIERAIRKSHLTGHGPLDYWTVVGHFNAEYDLCFRLSAAMNVSCDASCGSPWCRLRSLFRANPCRRSFDRDIRTITQIVAEFGLDRNPERGRIAAEFRNSAERYQEYFLDANQGNWEPVPAALMGKLATLADNDDLFNDQVKDVLSVLVERRTGEDPMTVRASYCPLGRPENAIQVTVGLPLEMSDFSPSEFAATELGRHLIALVKASAVGKFKLPNEKA